MPGDNLLNVVAHVYSADVQRAVLPHEAADTAHIVSVVGVLVSAKAVDIRIEEVVYGGQSMEIFALVPFWT